MSLARRVGSLDVSVDNVYTFVTQLCGAKVVIIEDVEEGKFIYLIVYCADRPHN